MQPHPAQKYRSITLAAVALALGGRFVSEAVENHVVFFYVDPPDGIDLDDPSLCVPVSPLVAWTETLANRVRAHTRRSRGQA